MYSATDFSIGADALVFFVLRHGAFDASGQRLDGARSVEGIIRFSFDSFAIFGMAIDAEFLVNLLCRGDGRVLPKSKQGQWNRPGKIRKSRATKSVAQALLPVVSFEKRTLFPETQTGVSVLRSCAISPRRGDILVARLQWARQQRLCGRQECRPSLSFSHEKTFYVRIPTGLSA